MNTSICKPNREENATSFMLFAYFGIASSDNGAKIVTAAINRAYRDAASHVLSFDGDDKKGNLKKQARTDATDSIKKAIDELNNCKKDYKDYNDWHKALLVELTTIYNNKKYKFKEGYEFSYGVAQKWVNMTMKYLYVIFYYFQKCGYENTDFQQVYGEMIQKYTGYFHVPIDGYILTAAKDLEVEGISTTWSKIDSYEEYFAFQKAIRKKLGSNKDSNEATLCFPIDWEGPAWIESVMNNK